MFYNDISKIYFRTFEYVVQGQNIVLFIVINCKINAIR